MKSLPYVAAAYIAFLTTWTLSLLGTISAGAYIFVNHIAPIGPPLRAGIFDINASPLNFLSIRLTSPLNGHQYIVTLESTRYCFISTNATVSLSAIGVQPGNGGGLFQWIAGKVIKSQLPEPSTLKTGCWQWSHRLFETLESSGMFYFNVIFK